MQEGFYRDSYARSFTAQVISCEAGKKGYEVQLSDTLFYPEGGGQPADRGTLSGKAVLDCWRVNGRVVHWVAEPLPVGETVQGEIDWDYRYTLMQNHSGEHLFSGIVHEKFGLDNVGFHMDTSLITCDFDGVLSEAEVRECEVLANEAIRQNIPVRIDLLEGEALQERNYRSKKALTGLVRLVDMEKDCCACCGTHVRQTGEIQLIKVLSVAKHRGGTRVEFVCGQSAIHDYQRRIEATLTVAQQLSAKPLDIAQAVEKMKADQLVRDERVAQANARYFQLLAKTLPQGQSVAVFFVDDLTPFELKKGAGVLMDAGVVPAIALLTPKEGGYHYVLASENPALRDISQSLNRQLQGRGGGSGGMVQGSYQADRASIEAAIVQAF